MYSLLGALYIYSFLQLCAHVNQIDVSCVCIASIKLYLYDIYECNYLHKIM